MNRPGLKGKPFYVQFNDEWFRNKEVIEGIEKPFQVEVIKVYNFNLWRKIRYVLGLPFKMFECKLVSPDKNNQSNN